MQLKQFIALVFLSGFVLTGCQDDVETQQTKESQQVSDSSDSPPAEDIIEVTSSGETKNLERFHVFLKNLNQKQTDHIRIISFTTEGDAIFQDLVFDGYAISSETDSTRDKYGSGTVKKTTCTGIKKEESEERSDYQLEGCENQQQNHILTVRK